MGFWTDFTFNFSDEPVLIMNARAQASLSSSKAEKATSIQSITPPDLRNCLATLLVERE
jgi:hypothetical protein